MRAKFLFGLVLLIASMVGCTSRPVSQQERIIALPDGQSLSMAKTHPKMMGLSPASTEMLFACVPDSQIVGVTHVCNYPSAVKSKPIVTTYPMDLEAIIRLRQDVVFTETGMTSPDHLKRLADFGIKSVILDYQSINDIAANMRLIGRIAGSEQQANEKADSITSQIAHWQAKTYPHRPSVLAITWTEPIIAYGKNTLMSEKIRLAGGINAIQDLEGRPYPELSREYILRLNPEVIVGRDFETMENQFFSKYPELRQIKAYQLKQIYPLTDDLSSRPSPRVLESIQEIADALKGVR